MHIRAGPAVRPSRKRRLAVARSQIARSGRAACPAGPDYTGSPPAFGVAARVGRVWITAPIARRTQLSCTLLDRTLLSRALLSCMLLRRTPQPAERVGVRLVG